MCSSESLDDTEMIRFRQLVIEELVDVNCRTSYVAGLTPLMLLCINNESKSFSFCFETLLLRPDLDLKAETANGENALHLLCFNNGTGSMDAIRKLVERGVNVNAKTKMRANPLHHLFAKHFDSSTKVMNPVHLLLNNGIDVHSTTNWGNDPLCVLCKKSDAEDLFEAIEKLVVNLKVVINRRNHRWENALHRLLQNGHLSANTILKASRFFIDQGVNVNAKNIDGKNALLQFLSFQRKDLLQQGMVQLLIQAGNKLDAQDKDGFSALHLVCKYTDGDMVYDLVRLLIEAGADVSSVTIKGETAISLLFARKKSILTSVSEDVVQLLVNSFKSTAPSSV